MKRLLVFLLCLCSPCALWASAERTRKLFTKPPAWARKLIKKEVFSAELLGGVTPAVMAGAGFIWSHGPYTTTTEKFFVARKEGALYFWCNALDFLDHSTEWRGVQGHRRFALALRAVLFNLENEISELSDPDPFIEEQRAATVQPPRAPESTDDF